MNMQKQNWIENSVQLHQNTFPFGMNKSTVTIAQLTPKMRIPCLEVVVLEKDDDYVISKLKTPIYTLFVADKTASVVMAYFGESARTIKIGDVLRLENVTTKLYWNCLQLIVLENSKVRRLGEDMMVFSEYPNMSHMEWVADESGNPENLKPRLSDIPINHWMPPQMAKAQENARSITSKYKIRPHRDFDKPVDNRTTQPSYYTNYDRPEQRQNIPLLPTRTPITYGEFNHSRNDHIIPTRNRYEMTDVRDFRSKRQKVNNNPINGNGNNNNNNNGNSNTNGNINSNGSYNTIQDTSSEGYNSPPPLGPPLI